jgi:hypothetical protein
VKAKRLRDAGKITEGAEVEIAWLAGTNDARSDEDVGGRSTTPSPVYDVTDDDGHAEKVDTGPQAAAVTDQPIPSGDGRRLRFVTKLDWDKAKPRLAPEPHDNRRAATMRHAAMADYAGKHELARFKCGMREGEWAKTGRGKHGP